VLLVGTRSADHIRASSQSGCIQRPNTWLHPNASLNCQIHLAPRARLYMAHLYGPAVCCKLDVTDLDMTGLAHLYSALSAE
jgi:hypothetical protein